MDLRTTRQVAVLLDCSINTVLRLGQRLALTPAFEVPTRTGAKLWSPDQIEAMRAERAELDPTGRAS